MVEFMAWFLFICIFGPVAVRILVWLLCLPFHIFGWLYTEVNKVGRDV